MKKLLLLTCMLAAACATVPGPKPTPTPVPTPAPTPEPTPTPNACLPDPPAQNRWGIKVHNVGPNWTTIDATPQARDSQFCAAIGFPGNLYCPFGVENTPCRPVRERIAVGGDPLWAGPGEISPEGPYLYRVRHGVAGDVTVCNHFGLCATLRLTGAE